MSDDILAWAKELLAEERRTQPDKVPGLRIQRGADGLWRTPLGETVDIGDLAQAYADLASGKGGVLMVKLSEE